MSCKGDVSQCDNFEEVFFFDNEESVEPVVEGSSRDIVVVNYDLFPVIDLGEASHVDMHLVFIYSIFIYSSLEIKFPYIYADLFSICNLLLWDQMPFFALDVVIFFLGDGVGVFF